ncbi:MAG: helix-turn-helix domain-containing protein, partial [Methanosarcinales archaeon]
MNVEELNKLIETGESQTLEFKKSLADMDRIVEEICGFANTDGGTLIVGVSDSKEVFGVNIGKDTNNTDPVIYPSIEILDVEGKNLIVLELEECKNKPYLAFGRAFKRVGKSTVQMSRDEFERLILEKRKV